MKYSCFLGTFYIVEQDGLLNLSSICGVESEGSIVQIVKERLDDYFSRKPLDLKPLLNKIKASTREMIVYQALININSGSTICYSELAKKAGLTGVRNVATIIAKNPLPILIPCHRVIRKNGNIGKYSFLEGAKTKQMLLDYENPSNIHVIK